MTEHRLSILFIMASPIEWKVLNEHDFPTDNNNSKIKARVTSLNTALMLDLRNYYNDKPTKIGTAFHLPELKWIIKTLNASKEGSLHRAFREISVSKSWNRTKLAVYKKRAGITNEITLYSSELNYLLENSEGLLKYMEEKAIESNIPTDFIAGEKIREEFLE